MRRQHRCPLCSAAIAESQACAWKHPFVALPPTHAPRIAGGDTLIIGAGQLCDGHRRARDAKAARPSARDCVDAVDARAARRRRGQPGSSARATTRNARGAPELWATAGAQRDPATGGQFQRRDRLPGTDRPQPRASRATTMPEAAKGETIALQDRMRHPSAPGARTASSPATRATWCCANSTSTDWPPTACARAGLRDWTLERRDTARQRLGRLGRQHQPRRADRLEQQRPHAASSAARSPGTAAPNATRARRSSAAGPSSRAVTAMAWAPRRPAATGCSRTSASTTTRPTASTCCTWTAPAA